MRPFVSMLRWVLALVIGLAAIYLALKAPHKARGRLLRFLLCLIAVQLDKVICTAGSARILTIEDDTPHQQCIAFSTKTGRITFVGQEADLPGSLQARIEWLPEPQTLLPGLVDAHAHLLEYGESKSSANLAGTTSAAQAVQRVVDYVAQQQTPADEIVFGIGWDQENWPGRTFPTAAMLDVPGLEGREIWLKRVDFHAIWVSTAILKRLEPLPADIDGGEIVRDETGRATGVFLDAAAAYVVEQLPGWSDAQRQRFLDAATKDLLSMGVVGVHDAAISLETAAFYRRLDEQRAMPLRIHGLLDCLDNSYCGDKVERYYGDRFALEAVKIFGDGALGSWGAAMLEPYSDRSGSKGILRSPAGHFRPLLERWHAEGWQLAVHAIGDVANRVVIDAAEAVLDGAKSDARFRIEHAQIVTPQDRARMVKLGIIASVQPTHATSDMRYAESRLGPERIRYAYAWQSMKGAGLRLPLSSDAPVEPFSPWRGMYAAITRLDPDTHDSPHGAGGWYINESLDGLSALRGFTIEAAFAAFAEEQTGTLAVGKRADFIVIDHDDIGRQQVSDPLRLLKTRVLRTYIDGKRVYHEANDQR